MRTKRSISRKRIWLSLITNNYYRDKIPLLSKSRFMSGLQCHKRLYLECFHPELATPPNEQQQAVFDAGTEFGALARRLFPRGLLIEVVITHFVTLLISLLVYNRIGV